MRHSLLYLFALIVTVNCGPAFRSADVREVSGETETETSATTTTATTSTGATKDSETPSGLLVDSLQLEPPTESTVYGDDTLLNEDTSVIAKQDVDLSLKTPQDVGIGLKTLQDTDNGVNTSQDIDSGIKTLQDFDTGVKTPQDVDTGVKTPQYVDIGVKTAEKVDAAVKTAENVDTGVKTPEDVDIGVTTAEKVDTALKTAENIDTGVKTPQDVDIVVKTPQVIDTSDNTPQNINNDVKLLQNLNAADDHSVLSNVASVKETSNVSLNLSSNETSNLTIGKVQPISSPVVVPDNKLANNATIGLAIVDNRQKEHEKLQKQAETPSPPLDETVAQKTASSLASQEATPVQSSADAAGFEMSANENFIDEDPIPNLELAIKCANILKLCLYSGMFGVPVNCRTVYQQCIASERLKRENALKKRFLSDGIVNNLAKEKLESLLNGVGQLVQTLTSTASNQLGQSLGNLGNFDYLDSLDNLGNMGSPYLAKEKLGGLLNGIGQSVQTLTSSVNNQLGQTLGNLGNSGTSDIDNLLVRSGPKCPFNGGETPSINTTPYVIHRVTAPPCETPSPVAKCPSTKENKFEPVKQTVPPAQCECMQALSDNLVTGLTKGLAAGLTLSVGKALDDITGQLVNSLSTNLSGPLKKVLEDTLRPLDKALGSVLSSVAQVTEGLKLDRIAAADVLGDVTGLLKTAIKTNGLGGVVPVVSSTVDGVLGSLPKVDNVLSSVGGLLTEATNNDLTNSLGNVMGNTLDVVGKVTGSLLKPVDQVVDTVGGTLGVVGSLLSGGNLNPSVSALSNSVGNIGYAANALPVDLTSSNAALPVVSNVASAALPVVSNVASAASPLVSNVVSAAVPSASKFASAALPVASNLLNPALQTASNTANSAVSGQALSSSVASATNPNKLVNSALPAANSVNSVIPVVPATSKPSGILGLLGK